MGPEGDVVLHHVAGLRVVPARARYSRLAGAQGSLYPAVRLCLPDVQPGWRQHLDIGPALIRRNALARVTGARSDAVFLAPHPDPAVKLEQELRVVVGCYEPRRGHGCLPATP